MQYVVSCALRKPGAGRRDVTKQAAWVEFCCPVLLQQVEDRGGGHQGYATVGW